MPAARSALSVFSHSHSQWLTVALAALCLMPCPTEAQQLPTCVDAALQSRFQDNFVPPAGPYHLKRGRANICADFNNDGLVDVFLGNPGDESFIMINTGNFSRPRFEAPDVLVNKDLAWGAAAADYDEDGDIDLFISTGGNEGVGWDYLFQNMLLETGNYGFRNVTSDAGVAGPIHSGTSMPAQTASANAVWIDFDMDGDLDLWVNTDEYETNQNILWKNLLRETGEATFTNVTASTGLAVARPERTLHSSWSDFDHDGDVDLFENTFLGPNRLWRNQKVETGHAVFEDVTQSASLPGHDLSYPHNSFGSAAIDFNQDGFDDILAVYRLRGSSEPATSPYGNGHAIFINDGKGRFANLASNFVRNHFPDRGGVMGFMVGDLNGDGYPEMYIGNGGPETPQANTFLISDGTVDGSGFPGYFDGSQVTDFASPRHRQAPSGYYPKYPYRTHGVTFADTDHDGRLEILVSNGGMSISDLTVREPNRHFVLDWGQSTYITVRLVGDGVNVNRDGVGARLKLTVQTSQGVRHFYRTNLAGTAFSAQNDIRSIHFALPPVQSLLGLTVTWSNGHEQMVPPNKLYLNSKHVVVFGAP
ncbi:MAG: CRTAC1 family protein [Planctomycetota bacterium]